MTSLKAWCREHTSLCRKNSKEACVAAAELGGARAMGRECRAWWGHCEGLDFCLETGEPVQRCVYTAVVEPEVSVCLTLPRRELRPPLCTSAQPAQPPQAQRSQLIPLKPAPPHPTPPLPPPHLLASAGRRGPAGSQRPVGSRQTAFSKSCQRVVGCSQAHPLGTCNHGTATGTPLPMWTQIHVCTAYTQSTNRCQTCKQPRESTRSHTNTYNYGCTHVRVRTHTHIIFNRL